MSGALLEMGKGAAGADVWNHGLHGFPRMGSAAAAASVKIREIRGLNLRALRAGHRRQSVLTYRCGTNGEATTSADWALPRTMTFSGVPSAFSAGGTKASAMPPFSTGE